MATPATKEALERLQFHIARMEWYVADTTQVQAVRDACDNRAGPMRTYRRQIQRLIEKKHFHDAEQLAEYVLSWLDGNEAQDSYFRS